MRSIGRLLIVSAAIGGAAYALKRVLGQRHGSVRGAATGGDDASVPTVSAPLPPVGPVGPGPVGDGTSAD